MSYERFALILDNESGDLGRIAMQLMETGIDALYTNDIDEAGLMAREEASRLGAVAIPSATDPAVVRQVVAQICPLLAANTEALVMVGPEPEEQLGDALRDSGAKLCLWDPYTERELRFVMTAAMSIADPSNKRGAVRIPADFKATAFMGRHRQDLEVFDLSESGAYFRTPRPFLEGSKLNIDIVLPNGSFIAKAEVMNAKTADKPGRSDVPDGMGVCFENVHDRCEELLREYIASWVERFQI